MATKKQRRDWRGDLAERVNNGEVRLADKPATEPVAPPPAPEPATTSATAATAAAPATTTATQEVSTGRAGKRQYDDFFGLFAEVVSEEDNTCSLADGRSGKRSGLYFLPLGFVPGPAVIIDFRRGTPVVVDATADVGEVGVLSKEDLDRISQALDAWQDLTEDIGQEPSPWNLGFARRLLEGYVPPRYLAMAMTRFRLGRGDPEVPFGVTLLPAGGNAMKVGKVFNPTGMAGVPAQGETLSVTTLREGRGPVQKLIRTWALMESNFAGRFTRSGEAREPRPYRRREER